MSLPSARSVAHAREAYYEDCPGSRPSPTGHSHSCNLLTAAILADREAVRRACAEAVSNATTVNGAWEAVLALDLTGAEPAPVPTTHGGTDHE